MKIGRLLEIECANPMIPVELTVNDEFLGNYMLTEQMKATQLDELIVYIDEYAELIKGSQIRDREKWNVGSVDFESDVMELKSWVNNRANFLDGYISGI